MDAHGYYRLTLSEARLSELRREAERERLVRSLRAERASLHGVVSRWVALRAPQPVAEVAPAVSLLPPTDGETALRRSA